MALGLFRLLNRFPGQRVGSLTVGNLASSSLLVMAFRSLRRGEPAMTPPKPRTTTTGPSRTEFAALAVPRSPTPGTQKTTSKRSALLSPRHPVQHSGAPIAIL